MNKEIKLLNVSEAVADKYRSIIRNNENDSLDTIRKKLTRNYLLGMEIHNSFNRFVTRRYGNLLISVSLDHMEVLDIQNKKRRNRGIGMFINPREKEELNKLLEIE